MSLVACFMSLFIVARQRLDDYLIKNGLVETKEEAFIIVTEGRVFVEGQKAVSPAQIVPPRATIEVKNPREYVGRAAYKLQGALDVFDVQVEGKVCVDIGAATGGFTEVLLKRGAEKVYAIDTAHGKLDPKLRENPKVTGMERTDVRDLDALPEKVDIAVIDVSLIPLEQILPAATRLIKIDGDVVAMFKPQYETRDPTILRHGIIKNPADSRKLLDGLLTWLAENHWQVLQWIESPIRGSKGNSEYLLHLKLNK